MFITNLFYLCFFVGLVQPHILQKTPKPYKWAADGHYNPLAPDGSDFPCKRPPGTKLQVDGSPTPMKVGETQTLSFVRQFSTTYPPVALS